jgi:hypothetical protein
MDKNRQVECGTSKYLVNKLVKELGFKQSKVDECVFYRGRTLYVLYTDDSLLGGTDVNAIEQVIYSSPTCVSRSFSVTYCIGAESSVSNGVGEFRLLILFVVFVPNTLAGS